MRIIILLLLVLTFSMNACTKTKVVQNNPKDSVLATLISSVLYFDEINQIITRRDSISYNQSGHIANWIYYSRKNDNSLGPTMSFLFFGNQENQINSYTLTSYDFFGSSTSLTYDLSYNPQNKLSNKTAAPPSVNPENDFNVSYQYVDPNNIFYSRTGESPFNADTLTFQNKNMIFRAHPGVGEGAREQLTSQEYLSYTSYPNPFYNEGLANCGALFFTCLLNDVFEPEFDYLGDVLSANMVDSMNFKSYLGNLTRDRGYYKFTWMLDSTGKVVSGDYISVDTTKELSGYEAVIKTKYHLDFSYKNIWVY